VVVLYAQLPWLTGALGEIKVSSDEEQVSRVLKAASIEAYCVYFGRYW
jgi:hypothetical protein